jgi:uncharacterized membrane protein YphA (DoxX/SURF4 family)
MPAIDIIALFVAVPVAFLTALFVYFIRAESVRREDQVSTSSAAKQPWWKRSRTVGYWTASISLSVVYILAGIPKLADFHDVLHRFSEWGYSEDFLYFIGASEFIAGILLVIPQTAPFAAGYLGIIMIGAAYTHLAFDPAWYALLPIFCLSGLAFVGYESWAREYANKRARVAIRAR